MLVVRGAKDKAVCNAPLDIAGARESVSTGHEAQFFNARVDWGELFDRHIE